MADELTFTAEDALTTTRELRRNLGLPTEQFPVSAFVGMISDEIEQLRASGSDDATIAQMISDATGKPITPDMISRHYAAPEERGKAGG